MLGNELGNYIAHASRKGGVAGLIYYSNHPRLGFAGESRVARSASDRAGRCARHVERFVDPGAIVYHGGYAVYGMG